LAGDSQGGGDSLGDCAYRDCTGYVMFKSVEALIQERNGWGRIETGDNVCWIIEEAIEIDVKGRSRDYGERWQNRHQETFGINAIHQVGCCNGNRDDIPNGRLGGKSRYSVVQDVEPLEK
jgi:hypothetical protein